MNADKLSHWWAACYNLSFLNLACLKAFCVVKLSHFCPWKRGLGRRALFTSRRCGCAPVLRLSHFLHICLSVSLIPGVWIGRATIWHPRKNKASPGWRKIPLRKRKGTENKLKARQTNQKADFPFSTFLEEEGKRSPSWADNPRCRWISSSSEAQGKDSSSPPVRRDCKHNEVSCRKTVLDSHWRPPH